MTTKHLSSQFNSELNSLSMYVMELGGLVEAQVNSAIEALSHFDTNIADQVIFLESRVNAMDLKIDKDLITIIALRQPTARDLRLLIALSKVTANLERVGDEATKIARMVNSIIKSGAARVIPSSELKFMANITADHLHRALDALARLEVNDALEIISNDHTIDQEFSGFTRKLITYMMEDPRMISASLDLLFIAKALERIGDHASNIAELIIYIVKGEDVRHANMSEIEALTGIKE